MLQRLQRPQEPQEPQVDLPTTLNHGVAPAVVCLRRVIKSSSVELEELEAGKQPPSASVLRENSSEDE